MQHTSAIGSRWTRWINLAPVTVCRRRRRGNSIRICCDHGGGGHSAVALNDGVISGRISEKYLDLPGKSRFCCCWWCWGWFPALSSQKRLRFFRRRRRGRVKPEEKYLRSPAMDKWINQNCRSWGGSEEEKENGERRIGRIVGWRRSLMNSWDERGSTIRSRSSGWSVLAGSTCFRWGRLKFWKC